MTKQNSLVTFLIVWFGDFISTIGSSLTAFSLGIYTFKLTGQATTTAMVILFSFLPAFLLRPIGGILADRTDRLLLMIGGNLGAALGIAIIFAAMSVNIYHLYVIYFGLAISSMFFALQNPAFKAVVSDFLSPELYAKASGLLQLSNAGQFLISPILGGILISLIDIKYILLVDIATFIFSMLAIVFVKFILKVELERKESQKTQFIQDMLEGLRAITANKGIILLISLVSLLLFYIGLFQILLTPMALAFIDAKMLGISQSICALGMLAASLMIATSKRKAKNSTILSVSLGMMGVFFAFIGVTPHFLSIVIPGFLFFLMIPYVNSCIDVLIRKNIDNEKQGRVWSLISVITYLGSLIAYLIGGFLADKIFNPLFMPGGLLSDSLGQLFGVGSGRGIAFIFFISGIFIIMLSICIFRSKSIRQLDT